MPKQEENETSDSRQIMTITVTEGMMKEMTEDGLLRIAVAIYQVTHKNEKGIEGLGYAIGIKKGVMVKALSGKGSIGLDAWREVDRALGMPLSKEYMAIKRNKR